MKKFSKILENKEFLGWSEKRIMREFEEILPIELHLLSKDFATSQKDIMSGESVTIFYNSDEIIDKDLLFHPSYTILLGLGKLPSEKFSHIIDGKQTENWEDHSVSYDFVNNEWQKLNNHLEKYKEDFYIFVDRFTEKSEGECGFLSSKSLYSDKPEVAIRIKITLIMKDKFDSDYLK